MGEIAPAVKIALANGGNAPYCVCMLRTQNYLDSNPDFRRKPKTDVYCWRCQKDLAPNQPKRWVVFTADGSAIIHPDDLPDASTAYGDEWHVNNTMGAFPVGMDCAKKIGMEWTIP